MVKRGRPRKQFNTGATDNGVEVTPVVKDNTAELIMVLKAENETLKRTVTDLEARVRQLKKHLAENGS